jgi:Phage capsid protein
MSDPTFVTQYREEQISTFEQRYSMLRVACVQEAVIKGNSAVFQVSGSGSASAVTRGASGQIPYQTTDNTQYTCTLAEKHAPFERTGFNIFSTQGDMKKQMHTEAVGTLNRDIDETIIAQLDTATQDTGAAQTATLNLVQHAQVILGNNDVDVTEEDCMYAVVTPAFMGYLRQIPEFSSKDYVTVQPLLGPPRRMLRWAGFNWITSTRLTGKGTSSEKCYFFHKNAIGHAANSTEMDVKVGYDEKQDVSWSRASLFHGAKLLQNSGIVQALHDGSAFAAT